MNNRDIDNVGYGYSECCDRPLVKRPTMRGGNIECVKCGKVVREYDGFGNRIDSQDKDNIIKDE